MKKNRCTIQFGKKLHSVSESQKMFAGQFGIIENNRSLQFFHTTYNLGLYRQAQLKLKTLY